MAHKITKSEVVAQVADLWREIYYGRFYQPTIFNKGETFGSIYDKIKDTLDSDVIDAAIGNKSWTTLTCQECNECVDEAAVFDVNGGEYALQLCKECCMKVWT